MEPQPTRPNDSPTNKETSPNDTGILKYVGGLLVVTSFICILVSASLAGITTPTTTPTARELSQISEIPSHLLLSNPNPGLGDIIAQPTENTLSPQLN